MESSSENSFTWTNTSSDSSESPSMMPDVSLVDKSMKYEKRTKKRSKCNDDETKKVPRVKNENQEDYETKYNVQTSMVKVEDESDWDVTKKQKKRKYTETNGDLSDLQNSTSYDESYLDVRVKEELMTAPALASKLKKKKNHYVVDVNDLETKHIVEEISPNSYMSEKIEQDIGVKTKKKKKKLKRRNQSENQEEIETSYNNDSKCTLDTKHTATESNKCTSIAEDTSLAEHTVSSETGYEISAIQCDDHNLHTLSINFNNISQKENNKGNQTLYRSEIVHRVKSDKNDEESATDSRIPRLSDRIRFEDEDDFESEAVHNRNRNGNKSLNLRKFIQTSNNMKLISQELHHNCPLTTDDEIWIVQCPRDIDVQGFLNSDFNIMHGKSKIKVSGITYEGTLSNSECSTTAAVLTMGQGYNGIHNLPLSGIIQLRKRIPKAHFSDDNIMINNQTNFIPLPDTKCRHPLFGANYKKAVKIPVTIAQQLNSYNEVEEVVTTKKRRKKKKQKTDKSISDFAETDSKPEIKEMLESELHVTTKKKKKRKHQDDDGPAPKRAKTMKHDPESAEAWESEKAIEQNLFNF